MRPDPRDNVVNDAVVDVILETVILETDIVDGRRLLETVPLLRFEAFKLDNPAPFPDILLTEIAAGNRSLLSVPVVMLLALPSNPEPDTMPVKKAPLPSM
jgi:hypothetical protein